MNSYLENSLSHHLSTTHHAFSILLSRSTAESGLDLTSEQGRVLLFIADNPGMNQQRFVHLMEKDKPGISRLVEGLERRYLVRRTTSEEDRRSKVLHLTDDGKAVAEKFRTVLEDALESASAEIPQEDLQLLFETLQRIRNNIDKSYS